MSENRDETTGQFAPEQPLTGKAGLEHDAGYTPMPDEKKETEDLTIKEAAEEHAASAAPESVIKTYMATGEQFADDKVTLTAEQAAEALTKAREAEDVETESLKVEQLRNEVDVLRGETAQPEITVDRALELPQVKEAIEKVTRETVEARERHVSGLAAATSIAEQSVLGKYPELANVAPEQRLEAFAAIAQNDPDRAAAIQADIASLANTFSQYTAENERLTAERQQQFSNYAKAESDRFEAMIASTPKTERTAIESNIVEAIKEYGGDISQFVKLMQSSEFASATVQRLLWDVGKYRAVMKATKAVASKPVPPVQRPGTSQPRVTGDEGRLASLQRQLSSAKGNKQLQIAAEITALRRTKG